MATIRGDYFAFGMLYLYQSNSPSLIPQWSEGVYFGSAFCIAQPDGLCLWVFPALLWRPRAPRQGVTSVGAPLKISGHLCSKRTYQRCRSMLVYSVDSIYRTGPPFRETGAGILWTDFSSLRVLLSPIRGTMELPGLDLACWGERYKLKTILRPSFQSFVILKWPVYRSGKRFNVLKGPS